MHACRSTLEDPTHNREGPARHHPFDTYELVHYSAAAIRRSVADRTMPPWGADNTGLCGTWKDARWLDREEIATVIAWADAGAPEGQGGSAQPAAIEAAPETFRADAALDIGGVYRPGLGTGGYRCFVADPRLDADRLLRAMRVQASVPRGLMQVSLFSLDSDVAEREVAALDASDDGLGYWCFGSPGAADARLLATWTGGTGPLRLTESGGPRLLAGHRVVVQIYYAANSDYASSTSVELELDSSGRELHVMRLDARGLLIPGRGDQRVAAALTVDHPMRIVGVTPRMHRRGKVMQITARPPERPSSCLAVFDHFMLRFQQTYRPSAPVPLNPGDELEIACLYGSIGLTPVAFGDGVNDEQCLAWLLVEDGAAQASAMTER